MKRQMGVDWGRQDRGGRREGIEVRIGGEAGVEKVKRGAGVHQVDK